MKLNRNKFKKIIREEINKVLSEQKRYNEVAGQVVKFIKDIDRASKGDIGVIVDTSRQSDFDYEVLLNKEVKGGNPGEIAVRSDEIKKTGKKLSSEQLDKFYRGFGINPDKLRRK